MGTIETFDHTADVGLRIRGDDLDDLFRTAAEGVIDYIVVNRDAVRVEALESLSLAADSTLDLLVAWLNELIFRSETRHRLYSHFDVRVAADCLHLHAEIGKSMDLPVARISDEKYKALRKLERHLADRRDDLDLSPLPAIDLEAERRVG